MQINIKILPGIGGSEGKWTLVEFDLFLLHYAPQLSMYISVCNQFPPLHILNEELMSGGKDLGMSGGCYWNPFHISEKEYNALKEQMLTDPTHELEYDNALETKPNLKKWCGAVATKYNPRKK